MKRIIKICVDAVMYIIFLYLMSYRAGQGVFRHGVWGCILFALFILHHILNLHWYSGLLKGKYDLSRIFFTGINLLLFMAMVVMGISSVMMSGDAFSFSPFYQTQTARMLHTTSTAWGFVLMLLHLGLHTHALLTKLQKKLNNTIFGYVYNLLFITLLITGLYSFIQSSLLKSMLLINKGNTPYSSIRFYMEYLLITLVICQIVHLVMKILLVLQKKFLSFQKNNLKILR